MRPSLLYLAASLTFLTVTVGVAQASGGEHGLAGLRWDDFFYRSLTLVLVVATIWKLAGKKISSFFVERRSGIAEELATLEDRKEKAQANLLVIEQRIASLEKERAAILEEYSARGEAIKAEIISQAEQSAAKIVEQAKRTAMNEQEKTIASIREQLAGEIVESAAKAIAQSLTQRDQEKLLDAAIKKVVLQ